MKKGNLKIKQQGMTLVEIMIALVLGIFLIAGVLQIFLGAKQSNRLLDNLSRMQENGRFAMDFISRDIREAGFEICITRQITNALTGINNDATNGNDIKDGTDSITVIKSNATCANPQSLITSTYTISDTSALDKNGSELFEGIENMQILYGEDTDNDFTPDYYVDANNVVNMPGVVSIRVNLLVVSLENNLSTAPVNYQFNGNTVTPPTGDHRLRREFSSTIAVRNRLP